MILINNDTQDVQITKDKEMNGKVTLTLIDKPVNGKQEKTEVSYRPNLSANPDTKEDETEKYLPETLTSEQQTAMDFIGGKLMKHGFKKCTENKEFLSDLAIILGVEHKEGE